MTLILKKKNFLILINHMISNSNNNYSNKINQNSNFSDYAIESKINFK